MTSGIQGLGGKKLSIVEEAISKRCELRFVLVGPQAARIADESFRSEANKNLCGPMSSTTEPVVDHHSGHARKACTILVALDDSEEPEVCAVALWLVDGFETPLPPLGDSAQIRNTCYIYLYDDGLEGNSESLLKTGLVELKFQYDTFRAQVKEAPVPRVVVLLNANSKTNGQSITEKANVWFSTRSSNTEKYRDGGDAMKKETVAELECSAFFKEFLTQILDFTRRGPMRQLLRSCDFDSSAAIYGVMLKVARDLLHMSMRRGPTTRWSSVPRQHLKCCRTSSCAVQ